MRNQLLIIVLSVTLHLAAANKSKPGACSNRAKREQCQCSPHGSDDCSDECSEDFDCYGQRKCCTIVCKRICVLAPYRPAYPCPPDQTYDPCPPRADPSCPTLPGASPVPPIPDAPGLNKTCEPRCACRPGYVKGPNGKCIKHTSCPPILATPRPPTCPGIHEIYYDCFKGCQGSCRNLGADGCVVRDCVRGCFCAPGFVRNLHGRCVRPNTCPSIHTVLSPPPAPRAPKCPDDQEFHACRRQCEGTCANPQPRGCFRSCQAGCFCRSPLVRDHYGNCVHPDQCIKASTVAPICGENEIYVFCSTKCQGTCSNPRAENCYARCQTGCFCMDGYVRAENGDCIRIDECPPPPPLPPPPTPSTPVCESDFEEYIECHRGCERTCTNPSGQGCPTDQCQAGCYCQAGLVRNHKGDCVPQHQCPSCGYHEHFEDCGPSCPATCPNQTQPDSSSRCDSSCHAGCFCNAGYVRGAGGGCVPTSYCQSSYSNSFHCGASEDPVPCGGLCERECTSGWTAQACPPTCRRRCCRKRIIR